MKLLHRDRTDKGPVAEGAGAHAYTQISGTEPYVPRPVRRFHYWVKRPQGHGGNLSGECTGIQVTRSDALVIFGESGNGRAHLAAGTWTDCNTEEI